MLISVDNVYKCQSFNMVKYGPMHLPAHLHYMKLCILLVYCILFPVIILFGVTACKLCSTLAF